MSKTDRAKQFLPFNSLRGYYDLIREKEKEVAVKRELSETDLDLGAQSQAHYRCRQYAVQY